jgi:drug/metabolite transporter (DMT)-like permease
MKMGMYAPHGLPTLSAWHVAALRMLSSGIVLLPFLPKALKAVPKTSMGYVLLSGWLGSFFPAFLFCISETHIDGALAGCLNALTPLFVIIIGALFYKTQTNARKLLGVVIGFAGCVVLTYASYQGTLGYISYALLALLATVFYGINVNVVSTHLKAIKSIHIATIAFCGLLLPSALVLLFSGFFKQPLLAPAYVQSITASCVLGIMGTVIASILFYVLVKKAGGLFASLVTYGIPVVSIAWGLYDHELVTWLHIVALVIILAGVYVANSSFGRRNKTAKQV